MALNPCPDVPCSLICPVNPLQLSKSNHACRTPTACPLATRAGATRPALFQNSTRRRRSLTSSSTPRVSQPWSVDAPRVPAGDALHGFACTSISLVVAVRLCQGEGPRGEEGAASTTTAHALAVCLGMPLAVVLNCAHAMCHMPACLHYRATQFPQCSKSTIALGFDMDYTSCAGLGYML